MEVLVLLIAASLALASGFLAVFFWATGNGQFDDISTPALRILADDPPGPSAPSPALPTRFGAIAAKERSTAPATIPKGHTAPKSPKNP